LDLHFVQFLGHIYQTIEERNGKGKEIGKKSKETKGGIIDSLSSSVY